MTKNLKDILLEMYIAADSKTPLAKNIAFGAATLGLAGGLFAGCADGASEFDPAMSNVSRDSAFWCERFKCGGDMECGDGQYETVCFVNEGYAWKMPLYGVLGGSALGLATYGSIAPFELAARYLQASRKSKKEAEEMSMKLTTQLEKLAESCGQVAYSNDSYRVKANFAPNTIELNRDANLAAYDIYVDDLLRFAGKMRVCSDVINYRPSFAQRVQSGYSSAQKQRQELLANQPLTSILTEEVEGKIRLEYLISKINSLAENESGRQLMISTLLKTISYTQNYCGTLNVCGMQLLNSQREAELQTHLLSQGVTTVKELMVRELSVEQQKALQRAEEDHNVFRFTTSQPNYKLVDKFDGLLGNYWKYHLNDWQNA